MIPTLFGQPNTSKFSIEWVPLMDDVTNSCIMDRGTILSNNISTQILEYRKNRSISSKILPPFYMSAYIMDVVCFTSYFPTMGWKWTIQDPTPIHIYHNILWESKYETDFYKICHGVMLPLFQVVFDVVKHHV